MRLELRLLSADCAQSIDLSLTLQWEMDPLLNPLSDFVCGAIISIVLAIPELCARDLQVLLISAEYCHSSVRTVCSFK